MVSQAFPPSNVRSLGNSHFLGAVFQKSGGWIEEQPLSHRIVSLVAMGILLQAHPWVLTMGSLLSNPSQRAARLQDGFFCSAWELGTATVDSTGVSAF